MPELGLAAFFMEDVFWIPITGIVATCAMVLGIVALVVNHRQRLSEMEHTLELRRMDHDRRMKELELELARMRSGALAKQ